MCRQVLQRKNYFFGGVRHLLIYHVGFNIFKVGKKSFNGLDGVTEYITGELGKKAEERKDE
jgi:hypothetical protein